MEQRPDKVNIIGIITIVSGFINISVGVGFSVAVVLGTFFFGVVCLPITLIPIILGIFEIIYGINILNNKPVTQTVTIGVLEIGSILWGNVVSAGIGIVLLVLYNDPVVEGYFSKQTPAENK